MTVQNNLNKNNFSIPETGVRVTKTYNGFEVRPIDPEKDTENRINKCKNCMVAIPLALCISFLVMGILGVLVATGVLSPSFFS